MFLADTCTCTRVPFMWLIYSDKKIDSPKGCTNTPSAFSSSTINVTYPVELRMTQPWCIFFKRLTPVPTRWIPDVIPFLFYQFANFYIVHPGWHFRTYYLSGLSWHGVYCLCIQHSTTGGAAVAVSLGDWNFFNPLSNLLVYDWRGGSSLEVLETDSWY